MPYTWDNKWYPPDTDNGENMKHIYITNCAQDGGIMHYVVIDNKLCYKDTLPLDRPTYTVFRENKFYTLLRETDYNTHFGSLISGDILDNGQLRITGNICSTEGICPCHLCIFDNNVFVTNYLSGNIVKIGHKSVKHSGHGVNPLRQEAPHTHSIIASPDGRYLLSADLGLDTVFVYDNDLNEISKATVPCGKGCRHLVFSNDGKYLYCVNELSSDVSVFDFCAENGNLKYSKTFDCNLPNNTETTAAAIRLKDGKLYVSHRGANCITQFEINSDGGLKFISNTASGGSSPRDFDLIDNLIITANEGGSIGVLSVNNDEIKLIDSINIGENPLCVNYIDI